MKDLKAIAYSSKATRPLDVRDIDGLLMDARAFNERVQVTGALLHHGGTFFQYFEGAAGAVAAVYQRIRNSGSHEQLVELLNQPIERRQFAHWQMAFAEAPLTVLEQLSNEQWAMRLPALREQQLQSPGLKMLLDFWNKTGPRPPASGSGNDGERTSEPIEGK
ncbi:MAG: BLUF domain-containing protein [Rhodanobacter sp.]